MKLVTRLIRDDTVGEDYAREEEALGDDGASIIRIPLGLMSTSPKEQLWDHLDSFTDNLMHWLRRQAHTPTVIHSHYADAGYVGVRLSNLLGCPGSHRPLLGRDKRKRLLPGVSAANRSPAAIISTVASTPRKRCSPMRIW